MGCGVGTSPQLNSPLTVDCTDMLAGTLVRVRWSVFFVIPFQFWPPHADRNGTFNTAVGSTESAGYHTLIYAYSSASSF